MLNIASRYITVNNVNVGSQKTPSGITLYDEATKQPFCVKVRAGQAVTEAGECGTASDPSSTTQSVDYGVGMRQETSDMTTTPLVEPAIVPESTLEPEPAPEPIPEPTLEPEPVIDAPLTTSLFDSEEEASSTPVTEETASTTPTTNADITSPAG